MGTGVVRRLSTYKTRERTKFPTHQELPT